MSEVRVQRRLAAILAADVVGYSKLMGQDEEGTLAALTAHRTPSTFAPSAILKPWPPRAGGMNRAQSSTPTQRHGI